MVSVLSFEAFIIRLEVFNKYYLCFQFGVRLHEAPHEASAFNVPGRLYFNLTFLNVCMKSHKTKYRDMSTYLVQTGSHEHTWQHMRPPPLLQGTPCEYCRKTPDRQDNIQH